jgi:hypothetical protein
MVLPGTGMFEEINLAFGSRKPAFTLFLKLREPLDFVRFSRFVVVAQTANFSYNIAYFFRTKSR